MTEASEQSGAIQLLDADQRVAGALPCLGCGYDLRTLALAGRCPECGRAVAETIEGYDAYADGDWAWPLADGLGLLTVALLILATMSAVAGWEWLGLAATNLQSFLTLLTAFGVIGVPFALIGLMAATTPPKSRAIADAWTRRAARDVLLATCALCWWPLLHAPGQSLSRALPLIAACAAIVFAGGLISLGLAMAYWQQLPRGGQSEWLRRLGRLAATLLGVAILANVATILVWFEIVPLPPGVTIRLTLMTLAVAFGTLGLYAGGSTIQLYRLRRRARTMCPRAADDPTGKTTGDEHDD